MKTIESIQDAIETAKRYKEEIGTWPTEEEWDNNREIVGISTPRENLSYQTGLTPSMIYILAGAHPCELNRVEWTKDMIDGSLMIADSVFDGPVRSNHLMNIWWLPRPGQIKETTGDTFVERKEKLGLEIGYNNEYNKDKDDREYRGGIYNAVEEYLINHSSYDRSHDGYVYVLEMKDRNSGEIYYYVGKVKYNKSLPKRINQHRVENGDFTESIRINGDILNVSDIEFEIDISEVSCYSKDDKESIDTFNDMLKVEEREKYGELINLRGVGRVLGGR